MWRESREDREAERIREVMSTRTCSCCAAIKHALRFHDLRHTCASLSIAAGAHPKLISARLGHSSIQITMDRYGHLYDSAEEALAEKLDATFVAAGKTASNVVAIGQ